MSKQKTEIKVLITSQMGKKDQGKKCDLKDTIKTKVKTSHHTPNKRPHEIESVQISHKTPTNASNTACAVTPRTPAAATTLTPRVTKAHLSDTVSTTPRTPATYKLRTSDSQGTTPCPNPSPVPCSVKSITARLQHTPLQSSVSKTSATNTPRQCPTPNVSLPKRFRQEDDTQKTESSHVSPWVRPPKNAKDVDGWKKDDDGRRKDNLNRVLSSTTLNVPSPFRRTRVSSSRLSGDSKTPTSGRSSGASKHSFGSGTQTPNSSSRRSSASHSRPSNRSYPPSGGLVNLTPEVVSNYHPVKLPTSPGVVNCYGGAESTSVSVGVRVRPLSSREQSSAEMRSVVDVVGNNIKLTTDSGTVHCFTYDHCFWSLDDKHPLYASQEAVYNALAQPLLEKAYEGYNTCLFAYGQTGSGKSYTMLGEDSYDDCETEVPATAGIIPRFCRDLLGRADYLHSQNPPEDQLPQCRAEVELSYIEIYNERIYDLLSSGGSGSDRREALRVREHPKDGPYVEGVAHHLVSSYDHLQTWLMLGNKERSIAATGVNDKSSRSHAVFTIKLTQMQVEDVEGEHLESSKVSIINLVDLAGSERVAAAQSQGDRLKEGVCINKSLLTLGKVITALAESEGRRRPFIPYRESVLTYLLKESLGGNSRTAMIATVSPCNVYLEETLSTLRYAQQARMIVNHNYINEDPTAMIIRSLKEEVERLRLQHIRRSPSLLFEGESMEDEEVVHEEDGIEKEKALMERENAIIQKEEEKNQAIKEKEEEIAILQEKLRCQQLQCKQLLIQNNRSLERRLTEAEAQRQQALESLRRLGIANEKETGPVLINLSEDPQLSETLSYRLKNGTTTIGHSDCDLTLRGLHTDSVHCSILNDSGHLQLHPKINTDTYVNGKLVTSPQKLHHNDRLVLAGIYYFRMNSSKDSSLQTSKNMDFYFTKEELLKEQEKRLQREAEMAIASSKAEMEQEMCHQRDRLMNDIQEARNQLMNKQQLVCELEGTQWKLEAEKRLLEEQILRDRKNSQPLDLSLQSTTLLHSNILQEVEAIFNESVQEVRKETTNVTLPILSLRIKEANQICKKLKKPYEFMMQEILNETGLEVVVLMKDLPHQMTATLTRAAFKKKLQVLRDIIQGEEYEDEMFETSLQWERTEDLSCVPGFVNKLLECPSLHTLNTSLNCSISAPSSILPRLNTSRRNNILLGVEHSNIASNSEMTACKGSVTVAATVHWALASLPSADPLTPPLTTALNAVADLYGVTVHIRDHITEPGHTLADGDLSRKLIHLYHSSQTAVSSLLAVVSNENTTDCKEGVQLQDKLRRAATKITNCASRIFQGVKNEVDSLVEEECGTLTSLAQTLVADIAKLALLAPLPVPTFTKLIPGGVLFKKFTDGLRHGLDWLVINSGKTASKTTVLLAAPTCKEVDRSESCDALSLACQSATSAISAFLKKFAQLNATLNYDQSLPEDEQTRKIILWVNRVESAADTITQLTVAVLAVMNHVTLSQQGKLSLEDFKNVVEDLLTRLQYLMHFAGVSPTPIDGIEDCSFSSNSDLENSREFMDNLHTVAWRSVQAVENIQNILNTSNNSSESKSSTSHVIKYNKKHLTQWPRNSEEYQKLLQKLAEQKQSQMKSSLRSSTGVPSEEKRVRFDVSCTSSSSSVSCVEEIDI